jgi:hypothetical protein
VTGGVIYVQNLDKLSEKRHRSLTARTVSSDEAKIAAC